MLDLIRLPFKVAAIATSCEENHQAAETELGSDFYYRFNPRMTTAIGLGEWKKMKALEAIATRYLAGDAAPRLDDLAARMEWAGYS